MTSICLAVRGALALSCIALPFSAAAQDITAADWDEAIAYAKTTPEAAPDVLAATAVLPAHTPVLVMLDQELTTADASKGDMFSVTVLHDVVQDGTIVVPQGTRGTGEVTFATNKGGFGKPGILGIALRHLDIEGKKIALDGRYREEGANNNGATVATWLAVGVFSGFITGKRGVIPLGRELKARTGEDIVFTPAASAAVTPAIAAGQAPDHASTQPAPSAAEPSGAELLPVNAPAQPSPASN